MGLGSGEREVGVSGYESRVAEILEVVSVATVLLRWVVGPDLAEDGGIGVWSEEDVLVLDVRIQVVRPAGSRRLGAGRGHERIRLVVGDVHDGGEPDLLEVADAGGLFSRDFGLGEYGEKDRRKNRDDRDHDQKFDESKGFLHSDPPKMFDGSKYTLSSRIELDLFDVDGVDLTIPNGSAR